MSNIVIKEFEQIGKYRVRVIVGTKGELQLDIREFVVTAKRSVFTRRAIRVDLSEFEALIEDSLEIIKALKTPNRKKTKLRKAASNKKD